MRSYKEQRLYKDTLQVNTAWASAGRYGAIASVSSAVNWTVYQGSAALKPKTFARVVGDTEGEARIKKANGTVAGVSVVSGLLGIAGLAGGLAMIGDDAPNNDVAGVVLATGVGSVGLGIGTGLPLGWVMRRSWVASAYEADEADEWIHNHNDHLRAELGLAEQDVLGMETQNP